jgi:hypothetical protein
LAAGCNYTGKPVEFAKVCDKENHKQYVEITGYFKNSGSAMCSKSGNNPMRCPVGFVDTQDQKLPVLVELDLGSGASSIENVEGKPLVIHDDKKQEVSNTEKVKLTAEAFVPDSTPMPDAKYAPCVLTAKKVEKAK